VGGCVRDLLLWREPEDFDVATSAHPEQVIALFERTVPVGAKFGVVLVLVGDAQIEVATFRKEEGYSDRRRPDHVEFSTAQEDAQRRDFTINGLFMDPISGDVHDYVGGRTDLEAKLIRAINDPKARFEEDALRVLRAVRFAANLGFNIENETFAALVECVPLIQHISVERIRDELVKGFTRSHADHFLQLLSDSGLLNALMPEVEAMKGCEQPPQFHPEGDVFEHTKLMLSLLPANPSPALAFATLLHDVGKPPTFERAADRIRFNNHDKVGAEMADAICRRLLFPNAVRENVIELVARHMNFMNITKMKESTLRRFLAADTIDEDLQLHRVDCLSSHGDLEYYDFAVQKLAAVREEQEGKAALPEPLISGHELIALGLTPGPSFKRILQAVQDAQLENRVTTSDEALLLAEELAKSEGDLDQ
jgi:putative nucleotidyltransferase with HDIG domain